MNGVTAAGKDWRDEKESKVSSCYWGAGGGAMQVDKGQGRKSGDGARTCPHAKQVGGVGGVDLVDDIGVDLQDGCL